MFETVSRGFRNARLKLQGKTEITEDAIAEALRDVRVSLLEADVDLDVIRDFLEKVRAQVLGRVVKLKVPKGYQVTAADYFVKACYDELQALMGPEEVKLGLDGKPALIMMVGLQGSGKTTTAGKIAKYLQRQGKKPLLVAADIYRPAAIDQLTTLGRKLNLPVFSIKGMNPVQLCQLAVTQARNVGRDVVIFDTAGRLAIDDTLMAELEGIKEKTAPQNILFVCDAMIGQDAVRTAAEFDRRLSFTGFVLTKLDGDARGGAALSIRAVTGKPIVFLGQGESLDKLEEFRAEGLASRILGMGDVVGLMKDFEQHVDQATAERDARRMLEGQFTFDDFQGQLRMIKSMGSLRDVLAKLPFMDDMLSQVPKEALDDRELVKVEAMIQSMTKQERRKPDLLDDSRMRRIAKGSGHTLTEVQGLKERFLMTRSMMKDLGMATGMSGTVQQQREMQRRMGAMAREAQLAMGGAMPSMEQAPASPAKRELTDKEKEAKRKRLRAEKAARKKQRR